MIHRRLLYDDAFGVGEPLNETAIGQGLDDRGKAAKRLEIIVNWRAKYFGLPYGDQGLLINRKFYNYIGGFKSIPIMEDVDKLSALAIEHDIEYDGWGTYFQE